MSGSHATHAAARNVPDDTKAPKLPRDGAVDPVCGMSVRPDRAAATRTWQGEGVYFCSTSCARKFGEHPDAFMSGKKGRSSAPAAHHEASEQRAQKYTCPMHPEVIRDAPGNCPKCGMSLEPVDAGAEENESELRDMTRRFWVSLVLTIPVFLSAMFGMLFPEALESLVTPAGQRWAECALASGVVAYGAWPFFLRAIESIRAISPNMFTLIGMGVLVAYVYSVIVTIWPTIVPAEIADGESGTHVYFEAACVITTLILLGQVLELRARRKAGSAIRELLELSPATGIRIDKNGEDEEVPLEHIAVDDRLRVVPGDKVPLDGVLVEGSTTIDESMLTGEPTPVSKSQDDEVTGGTINQRGSFVMRVTRTGQETVLSQIVEMVAKAQRSRAPIQRLADVVAAWFVPAVIAIAILSFSGWMLFGPEPRISFAIVSSVSVLIIACPCALGLATPMSIMVGTGAGAKRGVLIKDAAALETLSRVDTLIIDKTGTLTEGRPRLREVHVVAAGSKDLLLDFVLSVEKLSEHPLAEAIANGAKEKGAEAKSATDFESHTGMGVTATVDGSTVVIGNDAMMRARGIDASALKDRAEQLRSQGHTVMLVGRDSSLLGLVSVADPIKETSKDAIARLRRQGLRIIMATGDHSATANAVASQMGIDDVYAEVKPHDKAAIVKRLQNDGKKVAFAGDGVNDAPALAQSDVGIAMGTGAGVAIESAGMTLVSGDLQRLADARMLSRKVMRNIKQNLFFAFFYNGAGVPIAAGVLYPVMGMLLSPMIAAAAMSFSSVSVIANALRLRLSSLSGD